MLYYTLVKGWSHEMVQHMAMLPARHLAIDESFKVNCYYDSVHDVIINDTETGYPSYCKIHGVSVFALLQSTVNEIGECQAMMLTSTKAHDQFMPVLGCIPKSLAMSGHCPTQVVFTDNVLADKCELETIFPELLKDVVPVPEYSTIEPLHLPDDWTIVPLNLHPSGQYADEHHHEPPH